jgi:hypothetical protein
MDHKKLYHNRGVDLANPPWLGQSDTSSWKVLEINGFKLIFPLATMAKALGYKLQ